MAGRTTITTTVPWSAIALPTVAATDSGLLANVRGAVQVMVAVFDPVKADVSFVLTVASGPLMS